MHVLSEHLHASLLNDEGLVLSVRDGGAVADEVDVHPVKFVCLYGPVVRVCRGIPDSHRLSMW